MGCLLVFQFAFVLWYEYCLVSFQSFLFTIKLHHLVIAPIQNTNNPPCYA